VVFAQPISYDVSGIQGRQVGLRVDNAQTHFQEVALKQIVNVTRYYHLGSQQVAECRGGVLYYLLSDHPSMALRAGLGSTALTVDSSAAKVAEPGNHLATSVELDSQAATGDLWEWGMADADDQSAG
jgi:hypothetical protein